MTVARTHRLKKIKPSGIPRETDEFIRNDYRFNIYAIYIWFAVDFTETILLIDRIIDFGDGIAAACRIVYTFVEWTINRRYSVISHCIVFDCKSDNTVFVKYAVRVQKIQLEIMIRNTVVDCSRNIDRRSFEIFGFTARLIHVHKEFFIRTFGKLDYLQ